MNDLMKVGETLNAKETINSIEIAELTGKRHSDVLRDIRILVEQLGNQNERNFALVNYEDSKGEKRPCYVLTKKGSLCLAAGYDAGLRMKIIDRWEQLEKERMDKIIMMPNFSNPAEAARAWALEYEAKQQALLEAKDAKDNVKRLIHDTKTYTATQVAKELGMCSAQELNNILESKKIQYKQNGTWLLYAKYSELGYVSIKQMELDNGHIVYDRRWTGKGRDFLLKLFKEDSNEQP